MQKHHEQISVVVDMTRAEEHVFLAACGKSDDRTLSPGIALPQYRRLFMAKSKDRDVFPSSDQPHRAVLLELKGERAAEDGSAAMTSTEIFAALSMEEVIAYVRNRQPAVEIMELKVVGKVQVLSSSKHLAE